MADHDEGLFRPIAFGWTRKKGEPWVRRMIRRCSGCKHTDMSIIRYLDREYDYCANCLSQDVGPGPTVDTVRCRNCGMITEDCEMDGAPLEEEEGDESWQ